MPDEMLDPLWLVPGCAAVGAVEPGFSTRPRRF